MENIIMKSKLVKNRKLLCGISALLTVMMLAGCGGDEDKPLNELKVDKYVTLGDYTNLAVSVEPAAVTDAEVDELTLSTYNNYVTAADGITDRAVATGDTVDIDYEGKKDGVAFAGGTAAGASLIIGSGQFIDGFEDGLIGVMPGETVDLNLTFPEGYGNQELAGQAVVFTVTVNFIKPGLDGMKDSVVANIGIENVNTVEGLRQYAYDYLYANALDDYDVRLQNAILDELMARCTFEKLPEKIVEERKQILTENLEYYASLYGVTPNQLAKEIYQMSAGDFVNDYAEEYVKQNLILQAIANREGLSISDEELQSLLEEYALYIGYASVDDLLKGESKEAYRNDFMRDKVLDFLQEQQAAS